MKFKQRLSFKVFMAFCFIVSCIFMVGVEPRNAEAALTDGLVAYYPFNGNANDESGKGNNGTVNGATLTADRFGNANKAYSFDGSTNIEISNSTLFNSNQHSIFCWVRANTWGGDLVSKDGESYERQWLIGSFRGDGAIRAHVWTSDGGGVYEDSNTVIHTGEWHHIAQIWNGSQLMLYIDGQIDINVSVLGSLANGSQPVRIGGGAPIGDGVQLYFNGVIDDIRIYNRALSAAEIQELYTEQQTPFNLVLSVSPASSNVSNSAGTTSFAVSNTGSGTMNWTAAVTSATWLKITSGSSGSNTGTINCAFEANTTTSARTATIRVTATGATGSPKDITVTQPPDPGIKPALTLSSASGSPSGTVTVNLSLTNVTGVNVAAISTDIDFDSSIFEAYPSDTTNAKNPVAVIGAAGTAAGKRVISNLVDSNTLRVGIYSENTTAIANGVVASITFYIKSTAINGLTTDITQIPSGSDSNSNDVTITGTKGTVTINSCKLGDCDCNGTVSIAEVQSAVNMYLSKKTVTSCCDRDGNGSVSISEVQAIVNNYLGIVPKSKHATRDKKQPAQVNIERAHDGYSLSLIPNKNSISAMSIDVAYPVGLAGKISFTLGASAELVGKELVQNQIQPGITRIGLIDAFDNQSIDDGEILFVHVDGDSAEGDVSFKVTASDEAGEEIQVR